MATSSASEIQTDYLNLLVTQLQYQDPMDPMDNSEMTSQLTQLGQLEQLSNITTMFQSALSNAEKGQAASYIGKEVSFLDADGVTASGTVERVEISDGEVLLTVGTPLTYTEEGQAAGESAHLDELDQSNDLSYTDTVTVYGTKPDGSEINSGNGAEIGLHDGWNYLTLGELADEITDVLAVDGQETYVADASDGSISVRNVFTGEEISGVRFVYNGSGSLQLPTLSKPTCGLDEVIAISQ